MADEKYIIYMDTGGTFSDAVIVREDGSFITGKAPTTPDDLASCFFSCIEDAAAKINKSLRQVLSQCAVLGFSTTAGTNALLTRTQEPRLGLITTRGFEDTTIIMRQESAWTGLTLREALHIAPRDKPKPLIPRDLIRGVTERMDSSGQVAIPLYEDEARGVIDALVSTGVEGIAVALLWSFLNDEHEQRIKQLIHERAPDLAVSLSSEVAPIIREYPRFNSAIVNLYIAKPVRKLFATVNSRLNELGFNKDLLVLQSVGGLSKAGVVQPIKTLDSGPVGGLVGIDHLKHLYGEKVAMGSDVGGTSFDICVSGETGPEVISEPIIGRFTLATPKLEMESIGAGGGTIAYIEEITGRLRVGPQSAGAVPGPACYDRGGTEPTITDADVVLGRIDPSFFLDGKMTLRADNSTAAIKEKVADPLGLDVTQAALGICSTIDGIMRSAITAYLNTKGLDAREVILFVYGGAGPTHCAGYSAGLGFKKVVIPPFASTFSAFGASTANVVHRYESSVYLVMPGIPYEITTQRFRLESLDKIPAGVIDRFNHTFAQLEARAFADMEGEGFGRDEVDMKYSIDMRYGGQLYEVTCQTPVHRIDGVPDMQAILNAFEDEYVRLYSRETLYAKGGAEIITVAVVASASPSVKPILPERPFVGPDASPAVKGSRRVCFAQGWLETPVYAMTKLAHGNQLSGPAIVEGNDTTLVVPPNCSLTVDRFHNLILQELS